MLGLVVFCAVLAVVGEVLRTVGIPFNPRFAQSMCISFSPAGEFKELYAAIVCGSDLRSVTARAVFVNSGLIHILVVSGSHLMFLETLLSRIRISRSLVFLVVLTPFTFMAGLQAPVVRALVQRGLALRWSRLSSLQLQGASTALTLSVVPQWAQSMSFLLSWMCGLLLALPRMTRWPPGLETALKIFLGLLPFSIVIGLGSPLTILTNWLLGPVMGLVLFPFSLLCFVVPGLTVIGDGLWQTNIRLLSALPLIPPVPADPLPFSMLFWVPFCLQILFLILEVQWKRKKLFSVFYSLSSLF